MLLKKPKDSPIIASEYAEKFPAYRRPPGASITLIAALHMREGRGSRAFLDRAWKQFHQENPESEGICRFLGRGSDSIKTRR